MSPQPTGAVLWLHDRGETSVNDFAAAARPHAPWLFFKCPCAPLAPDGSGGGKGPVTSWFDGPMGSMGGDEIFRDSIKLVHEHLEQLERALQLDASRIVIGGFGQGAALAIAAGLAYQRRLGGILSHSGWVCQQPELPQIASVSANAAVDIMLIHG